MAPLVCAAESVAENEGVRRASGGSGRDRKQLMSESVASVPIAATASASPRRPRVCYDTFRCVRCITRAGGGPRARPVMFGRVQS